MLLLAPFEAVGAVVLELDAGADELGGVVEVGVEVSVAVEVEAGAGLGLVLVTRVDVDGGGAAVSSVRISQMSP